MIKAQKEEDRRGLMEIWRRTVARKTKIDTRFKE